MKYVVSVHLTAPGAAAAIIVISIVFHILGFGYLDLVIDWLIRFIQKTSIESSNMW